MVQELADYVCDCHLDPSHFLEICNLEGLGVDFSFFPDQSQVVFTEPAQPEIEAPATEVGHIEVVNTEDAGVLEVAP